MNILEAIYAGDSCEVNGQARIHKTLKETYAWDMADGQIYVCPDCNIAWQKPITGNGEHFYYEDFPTYGKRRKQCPKCKKTK